MNARNITSLFAQEKYCIKIAILFSSGLFLAMGGLTIAIGYASESGRLYIEDEIQANVLKLVYGYSFLLFGLAIGGFASVKKATSFFLFLNIIFSIFTLVLTTLFIFYYDSWVRESLKSLEQSCDIADSSSGLFKELLTVS